MNKKYKVASLLIGVMLLTSCSSTDDVADEDKPVVEDLYTQAMDKLNDEKFKRSIEDFEELERLYPYSKWATKSELMRAYAYYRNEDYEDAVIALERFIKLHPGNKEVPYAYYLKALSYYEQITTVTRDQSYTQEALVALKEVVARFPESDYARDAQIKLDLVIDHLAGKELDIGRFYLKQGKYIAAINRFQQVVKDYQTTTHIPEALHRLVECYMALGVQVEAEKYAAVLGHNYPGSKWYQYSYNLIEGKNPEGADAQEPPKKWWSFDLPFMNEKHDKAPPPASFESKSEDTILPNALPEGETQPLSEDRVVTEEEPSL